MTEECGGATQSRTDHHARDTWTAHRLPRGTGHDQSRRRSTRRDPRTHTEIPTRGQPTILLHASEEVVTDTLQMQATAELSRLHRPSAIPWILTIAPHHKSLKDW